MCVYVCVWGGGQKGTGVRGWGSGVCVFLYSACDVSRSRRLRGLCVCVCVWGRDGLTGVCRFACAVETMTCRDRISRRLTTQRDGRAVTRRRLWLMGLGARGGVPAAQAAARSHRAPAPARVRRAVVAHLAVVAVRRPTRLSRVHSSSFDVVIRWRRRVLSSSSDIV